MSHRPFRLTFAAVLLTVTSVLAACSSSKAPDTPLSSAGGSTAASHPEWSQYTFTIGDNGGDGSEELSKVTGAFDDAPYKVKFARFDYGPPLVEATATGDIDLGYVGDVPPITGAAKQFGFKIVAVQRGADQTKAAENIIVPKGSPIQTLADLKGKKLAIPQGSSAHGLALLALKSVGLTTKDVELVYLSPAAGATAFNSGKVDAWSIWNPPSAIAVKNGPHHRQGRSADRPGQQLLRGDRQIAWRPEPPGRPRGPSHSRGAHLHLGPAESRPIRQGDRE